VHFIVAKNDCVPQKMKVICFVDQSPGWAPILYMAHLFAELASTKAQIVSDRPTLRHALDCAIRSRHRDSSKPHLLIIAASPAKLRLIASITGWRRDYNLCFAWIIDSFWTNRIPTMNYPGIFDHIFITSGIDITEYQSRTKVKTSFLGWGTDALGYRPVETRGLAPVDAEQPLVSETSQGDCPRFSTGGNDDFPEDRRIDLLRVGRQPPQWDDDEGNNRYLKNHGIRFHGRPPFANSPIEGQRLLLRYMKQSKFLLAFSNLVSPMSYTHPHKEYISARWTDALGCGCVVAGIPPKSDFTYQEYFDDDAILELPSIDRNDSIEILKQAVREWTPNRALRNRQSALRRLDWRWRFKEIANAAGVEWPRLNAELNAIHDAINDYAYPLAVPQS
jgi:hypothetical protein